MTGEKVKNSRLILICAMLEFFANTACAAATVNDRNAVTSISIYSESEAIKKISEMIHLLKLTGDRLWPNYHISDEATLIHFSNGHVYAFDLKKSDSALLVKEISGEKI